MMSNNSDVQETIFSSGSSVKITCPNCKQEVVYHGGLGAQGESEPASLTVYGVIHPNYCTYCGLKLKPKFTNSDFIDLPEDLAAEIFTIRGVEFKPLEWLVGHVTQTAKHMKVSREDLKDLATALGYIAVLPDDESPFTTLLERKLNFWESN